MSTRNSCFRHGNYEGEDCPECVKAKQKPKPKPVSGVQATEARGVRDDDEQDELVWIVKGPFSPPGYLSKPDGRRVVAAFSTFEKADAECPYGLFAIDVPLAELTKKCAEFGFDGFIIDPDTSVPADLPGTGSGNPEPSPPAAKTATSSSSKEPLSSSKEVREVLERMRAEVEKLKLRLVGHDYLQCVDDALSIINRYLEETK